MSSLTPEEKKRRDEEGQRKKDRLDRWNEENHNNPYKPAPPMNYQPKPESFPDFPGRYKDENEEEFKKRVEAFLMLEKQRFQEWLDEIGKKKLRDDIEVRNGRLTLHTPEAAAQYLVFNPNARFSVSSEKRTAAEIEKFLLDTLRECKSLGIEKRFIDSIFDIHVTENGVKKVLTGKAKDDFLNNVVQKFEKGSHLELEPSESPKKPKTPYDIPHGAPKLTPPNK